MDSLRSSVFSGLSSPQSTTTTSSSFTIFHDSSQAEEIHNYVESGYTVTLKDNSESCEYAHGVKEQDQEPTYVVLIILLKDILKLIPHLDDDSIEYSIYNTKGISKSSKKLQMIFTRVGNTTGEVVLQIHGPRGEVKDVMKAIITAAGKKTRYSAEKLSFSLRALVTRDSLFEIGLSELDFQDDEVDYTVNVQSSPYPMFPGYPIEISSCEDPASVVNFILELAKKEYQAAYTPNVSYILKFLNPEASRSIPEEVYELNSFEMVEEYQDRSYQQNTKSNKRHIPAHEKETCSVLQLTKREVTYLIGKGGGKIREIRESTRANIKVVPINTMNKEQVAVRARSDADVVQFVRISGGVSQVKEALKIIEKEVYNFRTEMLSSA
ncbi:hypothetical protein WICPIJ_005693 [Wickerhamomyces pijperi]|uniref:K Homology domain-containing protein n=1 Tax=Wickerhamomyces pijperi TaxID=599730 RepID=A0A9P8Q3D3_WICPI|nr:hypothetical protein WICPIJ_005693 [Wickerhamomyces pijperi]